MIKNRISGLSTVFCATLLAGCGVVAEKTNVVSDEKAVSLSASALGYAPSDLTLLSSETEGTNMYVNLSTVDGKYFTCIINGGNLLTLGITNPAVCNETVKSNPNSSGQQRQSSGFPAGTVSTSSSAVSASNVNAPSNASKVLYQDVQEMLNELGYEAGAEDGIPGPKTSGAIYSFQRDNNLDATGEIDSATLDALKNATSNQ